MNVYTVNIGAARVPMYTESAAKADEWCAQLKTSLCQICYPILDMADVERADMMAKLQKSKLYKHNVKRLARQASASLHNAVADCLIDTDVAKMKDFAAYFESGIYNDVNDIRNSISKYMQQRNYPCASIIARMETVSALLQFEVKCYDRVCEIMRGISGNDMSQIFGRFRASGVLREWDALADEFAKMNRAGVYCDLDKCKEAHDAVGNMYHHAFEEDLIDNSLKKVHEEWNTKE